MNLINVFKHITGHEFKNEEVLKNALTHSSYANERHNKIKYNERLEFLGDAVLSVIISEYLFSNYSLKEGEMSKTRANIVCERSLAEAAMELNLGEYLFLGKGEYLTGGRERPSVLADAVEALIAALYLDAGLEKTRAFVLRILSTQIKEAINHEFVSDYKTTLQEYVQGHGKEKIDYKLLLEEGPDHNKVFTTSLLLDDVEFKRGVGKTKKESEQLAAKKALKELGVIK